MKPLAYIIITYNRPADMLALLKNIYSLIRAEELLEEIVVVNNASTADYSAVENYIAENPRIPVSYYYSPENLGVARGRNFAIGKSKAPVLIMLDDDAEMGNPDCLERLMEEFNKQAFGRPTAIVSFKVVYFSTREMQVNALPHKKFDKYSSKSFFPTYYYAGGAHAIKRESLEKTGLYPEDFFYGMEEYDLSYRLLDAGYGIVYSNQVLMLHKESPEGRQPPREKLAMMWLNKSKVAWRYLPLIYFFSTALMWSFEYLRKSGWDFAGFLKTWSQVFLIPPANKRIPVKRDTLRYLNSVEARLSY